MPEMKTVEIPACDEHAGFHSVKVEIPWICQVCGQPRGEIRRGISWDGSHGLPVDRWDNPCGHVDKYATVRREAAALKQQQGVA